MLSVSITTNVASSNPAQARFDLWRLTPLSTIFQLYRGGDQACQSLAAGRCFFLRFLPPIKLIAAKIAEILLKVALNTITHPHGGHNINMVDHKQILYLHTLHILVLNDKYLKLYVHCRYKTHFHKGTAI